MRYALTLALILVAMGCTRPSAAATPLRSGFYEGLVLSVSPDGRVAGHVALEQGEGVIKRCVFDFAGRASGGSASIRTLRSPMLAGRIVATADDELTFSMVRVRTLPGCGLVLPPEAESAAGTEIDRICAGDWTELARAKPPRLAFSPTPGGAPGRAYIVRGDVVGILARQGRAVKVVYPSERDTWTQGWVSANDLAPLAR